MVDSNAVAPSIREPPQEWGAILQLLSLGIARQQG